MRTLTLAITVAVAAITTATADVVDRTPYGFTVRTVTDVARPPDAVYLALAGRLGQWWDGAHTYSGDARNLSLSAQPGGCFCEALPNRGFVEHGVVVQAQPGKILRIRGAFGPLQEAGVAGTLTFDLAKTEQGTRVTLTYVAGGYASGGLEKIADPVDIVFSQQVARLKEYVEKQPTR